MVRRQFNDAQIVTSRIKLERLGSKSNDYFHIRSGLMGFFKLFPVLFTVNMTAQVGMTCPLFYSFLL